MLVDSTSKETDSDICKKINKNKIKVKKTKLQKKKRNTNASKNIYFTNRPYNGIYIKKGTF